MHGRAKTPARHPCEGGSRTRLARCALSLAAGLLLLLPGPGAAAADSSADYDYRVDLSGDRVQVKARFSLRDSKDFAFLTTFSGRPVTDLKLRDAGGERAVNTTDDPGVYRVDGLRAGTVEIEYGLDLPRQCRTGSCIAESGAVFLGGDLVLFPLGVEPELPARVNVRFMLPRAWNLVTLDGARDPEVAAGSLAEVGRQIFLPGDQIHSRAPGGELVVVLAPGWQVGAEAVVGLLEAALHEQLRLLGPAEDAETRPLIRVTPTAARSSAALVAAGDGLYQLNLDGRAQHRNLAYQLVGPLASLFEARLSTSLAGADGPALAWWRTGFTRYTATLASVRSGSLTEDQFIEALFEAWQTVSSGSPLAGTVSLAGAGGRDDDDARDYLSDGGFLTCFLLDVRLRSATMGGSSLATLLGRTRGRVIDNGFLQDEVARLAGRDAGNLFRVSVLETSPPPLPEEAARAGLELVDAGTGRPFVGFSLDGDDPVIRRVFASGPARSMGLRAGDRITAVDGTAVASSDDIRAHLATHGPGDAVDISVRSEDGQVYSAVLNLWERTETVLRRQEDPAPSVHNAWTDLTHGGAAAFAN